MKKKEWQKHFVPPQSYLNFAQNFRIVWKTQHELGKSFSFIPLMHLNTSMLEVCFYLALLWKGDAPLKYAGIVVTVDSRNQMLTMEHNPMHEVDNTETESPAEIIDNVLNRSDEVRNKETLKWHQQRGNGLLKNKTKSLLDRFAMCSNYGGHSKTGRGLKRVMDTFVYEMNDCYLNKIIEKEIFIEHAKVSVDFPFETCFKNLVLINYHADAKKFQNACKLMFGKLITGTENFCARLGSLKRSFTTLKHKIQACD